MDNSVFGGYTWEGLANLSKATASRGGLETEGLPERDTVVWMIEWGTMPTHSLQPFINENTGLVLCIASVKKGFKFLFLMSFIHLRSYLSYYFPLGWAYYWTSCPKVTESRPDNGLRLQMSLSFSQQALALKVGSFRWTFCMIAASSFSSGFLCLEYSSSLNWNDWLDISLQSSCITIFVCIFSCQKLATCHNYQFGSWNEKSVQYKRDLKT